MLAVVKCRLFVKGSIQNIIRVAKGSIGQQKSTLEKGGTDMGRESQERLCEFNTEDLKT